MWRSYDEMGFLQYSFVESVMAMKPFYMIRVLGGVLYLTGSLIMIYNFYRTIRGDISEKEPLENDVGAQEEKAIQEQGAVA